MAALPGMRTHGDRACVDVDGCSFLHGRSDDTLDIAGKRIGPAEIESAAVGLSRTCSAKIVRRAARATALHEGPGDLSSVESPDVLDRIAEAISA
jgi:acyl-coenzyme A synthetase/AMP-(fatty) acid ligase